VRIFMKKKTLLKPRPEAQELASEKSAPALTIKKFTLKTNVRAGGPSCTGHTPAPFLHS
jgi:hypothetical protein